ncbi:acetyl esterase [Rhodopseudomonas julia]|uniref:Acetyl esterase n=1 Tax=Rhodopseudomonas julia TaxID=200617 RepID=A0ABU0C5X3_9BRAD|nr:alpha/beta hydrolase [Rhodopseudomonas julia]MDQ0324487.1 acetyl esterase [Rhodopseudomonas julia]
MPIDPQVEKVLQRMAKAGGPPLHEMNVAEMRATQGVLQHTFGGPIIDMAEVKDVAADGPTGPIRLRLYRPHGVDDTGPAIIYLHGGGWVLGTLDTADTLCRRMADTARCRIVSVDYRLAPENPFPAGPEDAIAATRWIGAHAVELGIDANRLAIAGDSAGGSLAAVTTLALRQEAPQLAFQVLLYPATDNSEASNSRPSRIANAKAPPLTLEDMIALVTHYLPNVETGLDWRASPLLAEDHHGLPPALIVTGGHDPLLDDGAAYAQKLRDAGVEVLHRHFPGQVHGFMELGGVVDAVGEVMETIALLARQRF